MALNLDFKIFVIYILALKIKIKILIDFLDKISILAKYLNYTNIFLLEFIAKLLKYSNNNSTIKLEKRKQLLYSLIYSLKPIGLENLKAFIKINLANRFI